MNKQHLRHKLKNRHLQFIALGAAIGTGLFFSTAKSIHATGPSIIFAYILGGILIYTIMRALGEMTVDSPNSGSFSEYANRYIGKYAGFIAGWSAWFQYVVVCMVELTAFTIFFDYINPGVAHWLLCAIILIIFTLVNLLNVRVFGEFEFWFTSIKVIAILSMIAFSIYLIFFHHQYNHDLASYTNPVLFFAGGIKGFAISLVFVVFSFGGTEFVTIAAGEAENPDKSIPKAINGVIMRIVLFYIATIAIIIVLYPYSKLATNISPFVDVFHQIGFHFAAIIIDVVAMTAAVSAFNSCLYSASRMLYSMAQNHHAPKFLAKSDNQQMIPKTAILFSALIVVIGVIINFIFPEKAIMYLLHVATASIIIVWFLILLAQIYFRIHCAKTGQAIKYKLRFYPYSTVIAMAALLIVCGIMVETKDMRQCLYILPIWIFILSLAYLFQKK